MKDIKRIFVPGDVWIFFKIYTGVRIADLILVKELYPIIDKLIIDGKVEKFYFIRYREPDFHLRLRLLVSNKDFFGFVFNAISEILKSLLDKDLVWKFQLDTYEREIERYNPLLIDNVESIFFVDSVCVIEIIDQLLNVTNNNDRWLIAAKLIDNMLDCFNFTLLKKADLLLLISSEFRAEFGFNKFNSKQLNDKYRENRLYLEAVLENEDYFENVLLYKAISDRSVKIKDIFTRMNPILYLNNLNVESYIGVYIHMTMNRLFRTENRLYELIIYDFMRRYYTSKCVLSNNRVNKSI